MTDEKKQPDQIGEAVHSRETQESIEKARESTTTEKDGDPPTDPTKKQWSDPELVLDQWHKYEGVAMHFNDLLIRFRTQALGGLAAVSALAAAFAKETKGPQVFDRTGFFAVLLVFWIAAWAVDFYYAGLLAGAVEELKAFEGKTKGKINLSTRVEKEMPMTRARVHVGFFYGVIAAALFGVTCSSYRQAKTLLADATAQADAITLPVTFTVEAHPAKGQSDGGTP